MLIISFTAFIIVLLIILSQSSDNYSISYKIPGDDQTFSIGLNSDSTVGHCIKNIYTERGILWQKQNLVQMLLEGKILSGKQTMAELKISGDAVLDIVIIPLTPCQQIFNAFARTNFREIILKQNLNDQDCSEWQKFIEFDEDGNPIKLSIDRKDRNMKGTVDFSLFPDTIQRITIQETMLSGGIDFLLLPRDLRSLSLSRTRFTANLSRMRRDKWPAYLQVIELNDNWSLFGKMNCSELPRSLKFLGLTGNKAALDIVFHDLPSKLKVIDLHNNVLNALDLSEPLPESLEMIAIYKTVILGRVKLQGIKNCIFLKFMIYGRENQAMLELAAANSGVLECIKYYD